MSGLDARHLLSLSFFTFHFTVFTIIIHFIFSRIFSLIYLI